jgi:hypothetical protein
MPGQQADGQSIPCPICKRLERTFEGWNTECIRARSSLYCTASNRFEAYDVVEMERAKSDLQMHRSVCDLAITKAARLRLAAVARQPANSATRRAVPPPLG